MSKYAARIGMFHLFRRIGAPITQEDRQFMWFQNGKRNFAPMFLDQMKPCTVPARRIRLERSSWHLRDEAAQERIETAADPSAGPPRSGCSRAIQLR